MKTADKRGVEIKIKNISSIKCLTLYSFRVKVELVANLTRKRFGTTVKNAKAAFLDKIWKKIEESVLQNASDTNL